MSGARNAQTIARHVRSHLESRSERGAGMVEYGLLLVLVLLVAFASVKVFGETVVAAFDSSSDAFDAGGASTSSN